MLGLNSSAPRLEQHPSGTIAQSGRQMAGLVYSGILAVALVVVPPLAPPPPDTAAADAAAAAAAAKAAVGLITPGATTAAWSSGGTIGPWRLRPSGRVIDGVLELASLQTHLTGQGLVQAPVSAPSSQGPLVAAPVVRTPVAGSARWEGRVAQMAASGLVRTMPMRMQDLERALARMTDEALALRVLGWTEKE